MTWREHLVVRILLLVARIVADDPALEADLKNLANHISTWTPKARAAESAEAEPPTMGKVR